MSIIKVDPELRRKIFEANNGYCIFSEGVNDKYGCLNKAQELSHALPKYERYIEAYPLYIHSPFNLEPLCKDHHIKYPNYKKVTLAQAELREAFLEDIAFNPEKYIGLINKARR